ncbi:MAG: ATP-binding protein [Sterolibacteriaceae bacterium]|jgi:DNA replication protein DnaC|uniref:ATP-binding protein n=1 Tax=Candidatus Methylophosphatis roskildensis TaxID=2899263 RepID=A0A9D7E643_9PROT|nr:ATP-binding protein [Candidatus Methylophosphatis roskildensis]MBK6972433.1 ATP-binding protein [Candidatus Methylophosphatis roskildensis]MBK6972992.1 ATP-binding protein [Candidatus Methylophosphatis roskildensis]MBK6973029.1 ATP-binding protein [Candidatus Methylophosphatis roskildensis]MBK6973907.1 ATP-binding protein [Candidatus Methylophosphatis roskildensis]
MSMSMMEIEKTLKQLRLSGVRATLETRLIESQASSLSFLETFSALLQDELDRRQSRLLERRYQLSGLEERASLAEFDWGYNPKIPKRTCFELHTLKFIAEGDSALLIGQPGTGKSHIAKAIAYSALRSGLRVLYGEADELLANLAQGASADKRKLLKPVIDADLLVLDDLFLARHLPAEAADALQSILHKRYKLRRSSLITSNRIIEDWHKFLGDAALTTAILDRLLHRSVLLEFRGKSYRLKEAASRLAKATHPE